MIFSTPSRLLFIFGILLPVFSLAEERLAWTTSKIKGSPEPPPPYVAEVIWPHISFSYGLSITHLESENLMFITEQFGKIWSLPADLTSHPEKAELVLNVENHVDDFLQALGLAFHPEFQKNRQVFLYYISGTDEDRENRLSRFLMDDKLQIVPGSEENLIKFPSQGHSGGDIKFGPDGMLYFPIGDLSPAWPPDPNNAGQNLGSLASSILRIDVDSRDPGLPYHIPNDNPFVNHEGARPEIWAYGFRNPWRISFHPETGEVWTGDVGWEMWEMVYRVEKGGNYGWSIQEGPMPIKETQPRGPTPISPPTATYSHVEGASVTGGYFITSPRLPDLKGAYIYGDYVTGKVWALNWDGKRVIRNRSIADTGLPIVTFGQDTKGDLIFLTFPDDGHLYRLVPNPQTDSNNDFPKFLSETGVFQNLKKQEAAPGVYSFSIQAPAWHDGYDSKYWVGVPGTAGIKTDILDIQSFPLIRYEKPKDTVLVKTVRKAGRNIETQILHWDSYWKGYTYQWNEDQKDATLVRKEGLDTMINGNPYRFPGRDECVRCHGSNLNGPLAFFPGQMDREDQLERFSELGIIEETFVDTAKFQPLSNPYDEAASIETRARSWLHINCSHCHRLSGGSGTTSQMNVAAPVDQLNLIESPALRGEFGIENAFLIEPGNPYRSALYYRIATKGAGHMPMIGAKTIDPNGVRLVHDWIRSLKPETPTPAASLSPKNVEEALILYHKIRSGALSTKEQSQAIADCMSSADPFVINLFLGLTIDE
jgi:glucose/arabinose dehydrogenase/mono/diheme cytochrome c family protein